MGYAPVCVHTRTDSLRGKVSSRRSVPQDRHAAAQSYPLQIRLFNCHQALRSLAGPRSAYARHVARPPRAGPSRSSRPRVAGKRTRPILDRRWVEEKAISLSLNAQTGDDALLVVVLYLAHLRDQIGAVNESLGRTPTGHHDLDVRGPLIKEGQHVLRS